MPTYTLATKDPDEYLDYEHDLNPRLGDEGDTISGTPELLIESGSDSGTLAIEDVSVADGVVKFWIGGGADGEKIRIVLRANTTGGRTYEEGFTLRIKAK